MIGELAALGAAVSWTASAILYKDALSRTKPVSANIVRVVCTCVVLLVFLALIGGLSFLASLPIQVAVIASVSGIVGLGFGDTLYMFSLKLVGVARAVPVTCTYPLFTLLFAILLQGEVVTLQVVLGTVVIVTGVWLLSQSEEKGSLVTSKRTLAKGLVLALVTAVLWAVSILMINMAVMETPSLNDALAINMIRVIAIAVALSASALLIDRKREFLKVKPRTLAALVGGGIVALGLGWFFLTYSFISTPQSRAVPISSTTPLFSAFVAALFLHERLTVRTVVGSVLIVLGIFVIFIF